jgi:hypothetical protein
MCIICPCGVVDQLTGNHCVNYYHHYKYTLFISWSQLKYVKKWAVSAGAPSLANLIFCTSHIWTQYPSRFSIEGQGH